ncbi:hypothetical protein [Laceyella putida]|uniref:Uncharacterized protein n=1 Tax=Laceyella putida TaxID=110101 RepID=A0ABW2RPS7_9BACL
MFEGEIDVVYGIDPFYWLFLDMDSFDAIGKKPHELFAEPF